MRKLVAGIALFGLLGTAQPGQTQDYPARPVMMIVPHAPGGGVDIIARIVAERMRETLGQAVVVENVPAAAGTVGVERAARVDQQFGERAGNQPRRDRRADADPKMAGAAFTDF